MIGFLSGQIISKEQNILIINVNGVGYSVSFVGNSSHLLNSKIKLYIYTHVKEDEISLYGFKNLSAKKLFEKIISVSGIGPKLALSILSANSPNQIIKAIEESSVDFFTAISGIGKKNAQRLIIELKPKLSGQDISLTDLEKDSELFQALLSLGFQKREVQKILSKIDNTKNLSNQVKQALKLLK